MEKLMNENRAGQLKSFFQVFMAVRGFAIALVVAAHVAISFVAADTSLTPTDRLSPIFFEYWQIISPLNFIIMELARVAVPLFLFLAGYHIARSPLSWKTIYNNSKNILLPMLVWSFCAWGISWRHGINGWSVKEFIWLLISGKAQLGYYFIVLIIQFYIISRWAVPFIRNRASLGLVVAALMQLSTHIYDYLYLFGKLGIIDKIGFIEKYGTFPEYLFPRFILYFSVGICASLNLDSFKRITENRFGTLAILSLISGVLLVIESGIIFGYSYNYLNATAFESASNAWGEWKVATAFWGFVTTFFIIATARRYLPMKNYLEKLGKYSLQILLLHGMVIHFLILFCYKYIPFLHWYGLIGFVIWFFISIYATLISIKLVEKWLPVFGKKMLFGL